MLSILYFFLGTSLGSFIGLICDRFPEKSIIFPRSHCNQCGHPLRFFEMIPILSQLFLRFKCRFGEGDFLYLASVSLIFPFSKILIAIELACLFGLMYFLVRRNPNETVAFVPFLFMSVLILTFM
ncbi:prepilin peptidase [Streptococcus sp. FSL L8-0526]|uniref:prepilin peptidase n=1 Tax=Streptococcus TaxID=1301 RepID=UPI0015D254D5|nr:A24 family peptidase [Streptococcus thermophilus]